MNELLTMSLRLQEMDFAMALTGVLWYPKKDLCTPGLLSQPVFTNTWVILFLISNCLMENAVILFCFSFININICTMLSLNKSN